MTHSPRPGSPETVGRRRLLAVVAALSLIGVVLAASDALAVASDQQQPRPGKPRFRSEVQLVALDVCVRDREGRLISELQPTDFLVLEDNTLQRVSLFRPEGRVPLAVVLLIDRSSSMRGIPLDGAKAAAAAFVRALRSGDQVGIIAFNARAEEVVPLSTQHAQAEQAATKISAEGQTGLFEAVLVALNTFRRGGSPDRRPVIVILSDGEDTSSVVSYEDTLDAARRSGVIVYTVSLRTDKKGRPLAPTYQLARISYDTGGRAVSAPGPDGLRPIYQEIAAELRHLYRLGYVPSNEVRDGKWRQISVRVVGRHAHARTRAGYYALPPLPAFVNQSSVR